MTASRLLIAIAGLWAGAMNAQTVNGVQFVDGLTWGQVRARAAAERKYIFVDACSHISQDCQLMDSVLVTPEVAQYINRTFVSIKILTDTGGAVAKDAQSYRELVALARPFTARVSPSLLILSPDGVLVQRNAIFEEAEIILAFLGDALDPRRQYYSLLRAYEHGQKDSSVMVYLADKAWDLHEDSIASLVGRDYLNHYLGVRPLRERLTKPSIQHVSDLIESTADSGFNLFYRMGGAVDSAMGKPGYAGSMVEAVINREYIRPNVRRARATAASEPDWDRMRTVIAAKFGQALADRSVLDAEAPWYFGTSDWPKLVNAVVMKLDQFGFDTTSQDGLESVNKRISMAIFTHSTDRSALEKATRWMETVVRLDPRFADGIDTYANLLYKLGRTSEALQWEEKAMKLSPNEGELRENYRKMQRGEPTWVVDSASTHTG